MSLSSLAASDSGAGSTDPQSSPLLGAGREGREGDRDRGGPRTGSATASPGLPRVRSHALFLDPEDEEAGGERIIVPKQINLAAGSPDLLYDMGCHALQGVSSRMEDRVLMYDLSHHPHFSGCRRAVLLAVLDGHAGSGAVSYLEANLSTHVLEEVARQVGCAPVLEVPPRPQHQQHQQQLPQRQPVPQQAACPHAPTQPEPPADTTASGERQSSPSPAQQTPPLPPLPPRLEHKQGQECGVGSPQAGPLGQPGDRSAQQSSQETEPQLRDLEVQQQQQQRLVSECAVRVAQSLYIISTAVTADCRVTAEGSRADAADPDSAQQHSAAAMATLKAEAAAAEETAPAVGPGPGADGCTTREAAVTHGTALGPDTRQNGASRPASSLSVEIRTPGPGGSYDWCSTDVSYGWDEWTADGEDDGEYGDDEGPYTPPWAPPLYHSAAAERRRTSLAAYDSGCGCQPPDPPAALRNALLRCERELMDQDCHSGTTALVGLMLGGSLWLANVGDCRAVVCDDGEARQLTVDHKAGAGRPDAPEAVCGAALLERQRLLALGAQLSSDGYLQVTAPDGSCSDIAVSRNLGCAHMKNRSLSGRGSSWSHMQAHAHHQHHLHVHTHVGHGHGHSHGHSYDHGHAQGGGGQVGLGHTTPHQQQQLRPGGRGFGASGVASRVSGNGSPAGVVRISASFLAGGGGGGGGGGSWQQEQQQHHHQHHHHQHQHQERRLHGSAPGSVSGDADDPRVIARGQTYPHHHHHQSHYHHHHRKEQPQNHHNKQQQQQKQQSILHQAHLQLQLQQQQRQVRGSGYGGAVQPPWQRPAQVQDNHNDAARNRNQLNRPLSHTQLPTPDQRASAAGARFESRSDPAMLTLSPCVGPNTKPDGADQQRQREAQASGESVVHQNGDCPSAADAPAARRGSEGVYDSGRANDGVALGVPPPPPGLPPIATHVAAAAAGVRQQQQEQQQQQQPSLLGLSPRPPRPPSGGGGLHTSPRPTPAAHVSLSTAAAAAAADSGNTVFPSCGRPTALLGSGDSGSGSASSRPGSRPGSGSGYLPGPVVGAGSGHLLGLPPLPPSPSFASGSPTAAIGSRIVGPGLHYHHHHHGHRRSGSGGGGGGGQARELSLSPSSPCTRGGGGGGGRLLPLPEGGSSSGFECSSGGGGGGLHGGGEEDQSCRSTSGDVASTAVAAAAAPAVGSSGEVVGLNLVAGFGAAAMVAAVGDQETASQRSAGGGGDGGGGTDSGCGLLRPSVTFSSWTMNSAFVRAVPAELASGSTAAEAAEGQADDGQGRPPPTSEGCTATTVAISGDGGGGGGNGGGASGGDGRADDCGQGSFGFFESGAAYSETSGACSSAAGVLIPDPDLFHYQISQDSEFLICACDGLWDVMRNGEACRYVRRWLADGRSAAAAAEALCSTALKLGSHDNISVVVLRFSGRPLTLAPSSSRIRRAASEAVL